MIDTITTVILYMSLLGQISIGLLAFALFSYHFIKLVADGVKWVVGKLKPEETNCYYCKFYDINHYWCDKHDVGMLKDEACKDGRVRHD